MALPLMQKATAVWLVDNTALSFDQIAEFCKMHPLEIKAFSLLANRRSIAGSMVGGIPATQEMLDFCAEHGIGAEIEKISADEINAP